MHHGLFHRPAVERRCGSADNQVVLLLVCAAATGASKKDLNRRTSSGNWIEDRVTWKEELNYKKAMGYL